jgi:hypothetical protein
MEYCFRFDHVFLVLDLEDEWLEPIELPPDEQWCYLLLNLYYCYCYDLVRRAWATPVACLEHCWKAMMRPMMRPKLIVKKKTMMMVAMQLMVVDVEHRKPQAFVVEVMQVDF